MATDVQTEQKSAWSATTVQTSCRPPALCLCGCLHGCMVCTVFSNLSLKNKEIGIRERKREVNRKRGENHHADHATMQTLALYKASLLSNLGVHHADTVQTPCRLFPPSHSTCNPIYAMQP